MFETRTAPLSPEESARLVARIESGDERAENELAGLFQREVLISLRRRIGENEAARELANDVLIAVVCALRAHRLAEPTKLRAFVRGTVRNIANNFLRLRSARPHEEPLPPDIAAKETPDRVEQRERLAVMRRGLAGLQPMDREILRLTFVDGLRPHQIARDLGVSSEVVRTRKSRALHRLVASAQRSDA